MALWLIRAGRHGQDENASLDKNLIIVGWQEIPDISHIKNYEEMKAIHLENTPDSSPNSVANYATQSWTFLRKIEKGDLVVLPLKTRSAIAIGKVVGDYKFLNGRHTRKVEWLRDDIPRTTFGQDLLYSFGAAMTICQVKRNDAEERVKTILRGKPDPHLKGQSVKGEPIFETNDIEQGEKGFVDLEEQALDQIRKLIESKFRGHNLTRLVEAILNVQGYQTYRAPEGPDGGVDILAGYGTMGFDKPSVCVQVKSGGIQSDIVLRELEGVMSRLGAQHGLFVSWDGFNKTAMKGIKDLFFKVRIWDDKRLIFNLLSCYDNLPDELQAELPLKRIWVVVPEEN